MAENPVREHNYSAIIALVVMAAIVAVVIAFLVGYHDGSTAQYCRDTLGLGC